MPAAKATAAALAALFLLDACATQPMGPTVAVMPAPGKPFAVFQQEQALCEQYASAQVAGGAQSANNMQVGTALVGTALGAGVGALFGGGRGAAIGAGAGALGGTAVGAGPSQRAQMSLQQRYDLAYSQCMYSHGNQVPGFGPARAPAAQPYGAPPPPYAPQPAYPPPNYPPPPGYR